MSVLKLSELEPGRSYTLECDSTHAKFLVIQGGIQPIVVIFGGFEKDIDTGENRVVQLLGWTRHPSTELLDNSSGVGFFDLDEPVTEIHSLWCARATDDGGVEIVLLAAAEPIIEPLIPGQPS